jgi:hypothetical protein
MQMSSLLKEVGGGGVTPLLVTSFQAEHISFQCLNNDILEWIPSVKFLHGWMVAGSASRTMAPRLPQRYIQPSTNQFVRNNNQPNTYTTVG